MSRENIVLLIAMFLLALCFVVEGIDMEIGSFIGAISLGMLLSYGIFTFRRH